MFDRLKNIFGFDPGDDQNSNNGDGELTQDEKISHAILLMMMAGGSRIKHPKILELGDKIVAPVIHAIDNYEETLAKNPIPSFARQGTQLGGLCRALEPYPSMQVVKSLTRFVDSDDTALRRCAAEAIAGTGLTEAADQIAGLLRSGKPDLTAAALGGLRNARIEGRVQAGLGVKILPALFEVMGQLKKPEEWLTDVIGLMAEADPEATATRLIELEKLKINSGWCEIILRAFLPFKSPKIDEACKKFLDQLQLPAEGFKPGQQRFVLRPEIAALIRHERAEAWLVGMSRLELAYPQKRDVYSALAERYLDGITHETDLQPLSPIELQEYKAVRVRLQTLEKIHSLILGDGMEQFLINEPRYVWEDYCKILETIGAHQSAKSCQELLEKLAPVMSNDPSQNTYKAHVKTKEQMIDRYCQLEKEIIGETSGENLIMLACQYVISRRDFFLRGSMTKTNPKNEP